MFKSTNKERTKVLFLSFVYIKTSLEIVVFNYSLPFTTSFIFHPHEAFGDMPMIFFPQMERFWPSKRGVL
jgi:hypothetical protein